MNSAPETNEPVEEAPAAMPNRTWVLTPTHILEFLYCPRFTYFEFVLGIPEHQEKRFKVRKGREVHEQRQRVNPHYLRKRLGVVRRELDVPLVSETLHLSARADEVLTLDDGSLAPFDYKYAEYKAVTFRNHRIQAALYALLLRELRNRPVRRAFLCYTRSRYRIVTLPMTDDLLEEARDTLEACRDIILTGVFPPPTRWSKRCEDCCYANLCPKL